MQNTLETKIMEEEARRKNILMGILIQAGVQFRGVVVKEIY